MKFDSRIQGIFPKTCKETIKFLHEIFFQMEVFLFDYNFWFLSEIFCVFIFNAPVRMQKAGFSLQCASKFWFGIFLFCNFQVKSCGDFIVKVNKVQKATNENRLSTDHHLNGIITLWYSYFTAGTTANTELHLIYFVSEDIRPPNGNQCIPSK